VSHIVVRTGKGPDPAVVTELARLGVSTAHEAMGRSGLLHSYLRPIYPGACVAGRAVTVLSQAGDNLMLHAAIEQCRPGDVLVVATMSLSTDGMFGDLLATAARARGVVGLVSEAGVRDVATLTTMRFPVWSRAISAQGTVKATPGSVNVPVIVGGVLVSPGDVVLADDDGVVVIPLLKAKEVAEAAARRAEEEEGKRVRLARGEFSLDIYGLRERLSGLGVRYVEGDDGLGRDEPSRNGSATDSPITTSVVLDAGSGKEPT
jgi:4-hydroxy-4-methyl-2-oxoglutarate aldolase